MADAGTSLKNANIFSERMKNKAAERKSIIPESVQSENLSSQASSAASGHQQRNTATKDFYNNLLKKDQASKLSKKGPEAGGDKEPEK